MFQNVVELVNSFFSSTAKPCLEWQINIEKQHTLITLVCFTLWKMFVKFRFLLNLGPKFQSIQHRFWCDSLASSKGVLWRGPLTLIKPTENPQLTIKSRYESKKTFKMKISPAILFTIAAADDTLPPPDRKVPPRHPLQRLARLNQFTEELLTQWFDCLPSQQAWINKFKANGARMARNFERGNQRCP